MLPVTAATTLGNVGTRFGPTSGVGLDHRDQIGLDSAGVFDPGRGDDAFTGEASVDENHPTVRSTTDTSATGGHSVQLEFELWHDDEAMATTDPDTRSTLIVPSVLPADFSRLGEECRALEEAGVDRIQFDVMDGRFVPNLTFGADVIAACRPHVEVPFEAHLMIEEPDHLIPGFIDAGCEMIIVHAETCRHLHRTLAAVADLGASAAVALNPHTPLEAVANVVDLLDMLLVMTVNPGFGGQAYIGTMEPKIAAARGLLDQADKWIDLEVDGGISPATIGGAAGAGANVFISGSALYRHAGGLRAGVSELRKLADEASR